MVADYGSPYALLRPNWLRFACTRRLVRMGTTSSEGAVAARRWDRRPPYELRPDELLTALQSSMLPEAGSRVAVQRPASASAWSITSAGSSERYDGGSVSQRACGWRR